MANIVWEVALLLPGQTALMQCNLKHDFLGAPCEERAPRTSTESHPQDGEEQRDEEEQRPVAHAASGAHQEELFLRHLADGPARERLPVSVGLS